MTFELSAFESQTSSVEIHSVNSLLLLFAFHKIIRLDIGIIDIICNCYVKREDNLTIEPLMILNLH